MYRIDTTDGTPAEWPFGCPHPVRHRNWRVTNGCFECRSCNETYRELVYLPTGERVRREEIEFVGPHADQIRFGRKVTE